MILSDDFGMGIPVQLLRSALDLDPIVPASYVLSRAAIDSKVIRARLLRKSKRGQGKSPDFVAIDKKNAVHVIECKGTQTSRTALDRQMDTGKKQKKNIVFSECAEGQRLVAGMFIPQFSNPEKRLWSGSRTRQPNPR